MPVSPSQKSEERLRVSVFVPSDYKQDITLYRHTRGEIVCSLPFDSDESDQFVPSVEMSQSLSCAARAVSR